MHTTSSSNSPHPDGTLQIYLERIDPPPAISADAPDGLRRRQQHRTMQSDAGRALARRALRARGLADTHRLQRRENKWIIAASHSPAIWLSISHSGPWVICAVDSNERVGIDIESTARQLDIQTAGAQYLHPSTHRAMDAFDITRRHALFYQIWTVLEAWGKYQNTELSKSISTRILCDERFDLRGDPQFNPHIFVHWVSKVHFCTLICADRHYKRLTEAGWTAVRTIRELADVTPNATLYPS